MKDDSDNELNDGSVLLTHKTVHDIRNSLNGILGYSQILQDEEELSSAQKLMLESIEKAAMKIEALVLKKDEQKQYDTIEETELSQKFKVLIVDDHEDNRTVLGALLRKFDLNIFYAENAQKAIQTATSQNIDLIFMDLHMPDMNGDEASVKIKEKMPNTKIVALSGDVNAPDDESINMDIFDLFIYKPFDRNDIKNIVQDFMGENTDEVVSPDELSKEYLNQIVEYAKNGRISCLEDLVEECENESVQIFLKDKINSFEFEHIIVWAENSDG